MEIRRVGIHTPFIKLDQLLKFAEIASSGGEASYIIAEGWVRIGDEVILQRGKKIYPGTTVICTLSGQEPIRIEIGSE